MALYHLAWSSFHLECTLPDYALPGGGDSMTVAAAAYILSAVIGVVVCGGLLYFVGKKVAKD